MDIYEKRVLKDIKQFENNLYKEKPLANWSKQVQQKLDGVIPDKVHQTISSALEKGIKAFLQGVTLISHPQPAADDLSLHQLSEEAELIIQKYRRIATVEGASLGYGGIIASTLDFPALLSIKLKFLQEIAVLFGYHIQNFEERLFILYIFELQFSGRETKQQKWQEIKQWERLINQHQGQGWDEFDWQQFYMEYKQSIELPKLLQIIPGFGAIVGALANHSFLDGLGHTASLVFQMRRLQEKHGDIVR